MSDLGDIRQAAAEAELEQADLDAAVDVDGELLDQDTALDVDQPDRRPAA